MPRQKQEKIVNIISEILGVSPGKQKFPWLINVPVPKNFGKYYKDIIKIYVALGGEGNSLKNKKIRKLPPDAYFPDPFNFLFEFDEVQHFTKFKAIALNNYPKELPYGFSQERYIEYCKKYGDVALKKGPSGYRRKTEEFPFKNGRVAQRAFFDAFRDIQPTLFGLRPTIRIAEFELSDSFTKEEVEKVLIEKFELIGLKLK